MKLIHVPRTQMVQSDTLSRREDLNPGEDHDNEELTLLPDMLFVKKVDTELHTALAEALLRDKVMMDAINTLKTKGVLPTQSAFNDWKIEDRLLFFKDKCYMLEDKEL